MVPILGKKHDVIRLIAAAIMSGKTVAWFSGFFPTSGSMPPLWNLIKYLDDVRNKINKLSFGVNSYAEYFFTLTFRDEQRRMICNKQCQK